MNFLKRCHLILLLLALIGPSLSFANQNIGAGVIIGSPTGLSAKLKLQQNRAVDLAMAWDLGSQNDFYIHSNYLIGKKRFLVIDQQPLEGFYGLGGSLRFHDPAPGSKDDRNNFGIRVPVGLNYQIQSAPVEIFAEVALVVELIPSTGVHLNLGIGARYYF